MVARTAGRKGRPWRRNQQQIRGLQQGGPCSWCGHPVYRGEVDHRVDRSAGGSHHTGNLQLMHGSSDRCPDCNQACNQVKYWAERRAQRVNPTPTTEYARW